MGLAVDPHARENLMVTSRAVLESVAAKIPKEAQYRENVEATFRIWLKTVRRPPRCALSPASSCRGETWHVFPHATWH